MIWQRCHPDWKPTLIVNFQLYSIGRKWNEKSEYSNQDFELHLSILEGELNVLLKKDVH